MTFLLRQAAMPSGDIQDKKEGKTAANLMGRLQLFVVLFEAYGFFYPIAFTPWEVDSLGIVFKGAVCSLFLCLISERSHL